MFQKLKSIFAGQSHKRIKINDKAAADLMKRYFDYYSNFEKRF